MSECQSHFSRYPVTGHYGYNGCTCLEINPYAVAPMDCETPGWWDKIPYKTRGSEKNPDYEDLSDLYNDIVAPGTRLNDVKETCNVDLDPFLPSTIFVDLATGFSDFYPGSLEDICYGLLDEYAPGYVPVNIKRKMSPQMGICAGGGPEPSSSSSTGSSASGGPGPDPFLCYKRCLYKFTCPPEGDGLWINANPQFDFLCTDTPPDMDYFHTELNALSGTGYKWWPCIPPDCECTNTSQCTAKGYGDVANCTPEIMNTNYPPVCPSSTSAYPPEDQCILKGSECVDGPDITYSGEGLQGCLDACQIALTQEYADSLCKGTEYLLRVSCGWFGICNCNPIGLGLYGGANKNCCKPAENCGTGCSQHWDGWLEFWSQEDADAYILSLSAEPCECMNRYEKTYLNEPPGSDTWYQWGIAHEDCGAYVTEYDRFGSHIWSVMPCCRTAAMSPQPPFVRTYVREADDGAVYGNIGCLTCCTDPEGCPRPDPNPPYGIIYPPQYIVDRLPVPDTGETCGGTRALNWKGEQKTCAHPCHGEKCRRQSALYWTAATWTSPEVGSYETYLECLAAL